MSTCLWCPGETSGPRQTCADCSDEANGYSDARERRQPKEHGTARYADGYQRGQEMNAIIALRGVMLRPADKDGALAGMRQMLRLMQWWAERGLAPILMPPKDEQPEARP